MEKQTNVSVIEPLRANKSSEQRNKKFFIRASALIAILSALIFSFFLMVHTFSYDSRTQSMKISSKLWSDFGAHIPLIRSFSQGANLKRLMSGQPVQSPLFPGEPIRYHFGFYALVGMLENTGLRIDWAVNLPSALGFFGLLLGIWIVSFHMFRSNTISFLSILFFLCNGSLSYIKFFTDHPISIQSISDIIHGSRFVSFGPWDGGAISAFWSLNIYTNQRHLALSYALVLAIIAMCASSTTQNTRHNKVINILLGSLSLSALLFINYAAAGIAALFLAWFFVILPKNRLYIFLVGLCTLPAFFILRHSAHVISVVAFEPGYLIRTGRTAFTFITYWWQNIGLHSVLIPIGILLAPRAIRRTYSVPLVVLFILPNILRFSPDMINNHKFFNFFMIIGSMFSAHAVVCILKQYKNIQIQQLKKPLQAFVGAILIGCLTLSGIIDFFPIINDQQGAVSDTGANADVTYFANSVPQDAVVANTTWFYHPASLAGKSLYSGYTYFTWSYGYDQMQREASLTSIYQSQTRKQACMYLRAYNVSHVELSQKPEQYLRPNYSLWNTLTPDYVNTKTGITVYRTQTICSLNLLNKENAL